jgi:hypothetical protein
MKIENNRPVRSSAARRDGRPSGGSGFSLGVLSEPAASAVAAAPLLSGVDALFALQEVPDATAEHRQAMARGNEILDRLDDLRLGLLTGTMSRTKLTDLARLARSQSHRISDPRLREVLSEIELRAAVELAKMSQSRAG